MWKYVQNILSKGGSKYNVSTSVGMSSHVTVYKWNISVCASIRCQWTVDTWTIPACVSSTCQ